jgi:trimeric autotransporter adhesin
MFLITGLNQAEDLLPPAGFFTFSRPATPKNLNKAGERKKKQMNPLIQLKRTSQLFVLTFLLACFGVLDGAQAVITDPDDWFANGNTGSGNHALFNLRAGHYNTAFGLMSLNSLVDSAYNTGVGAGALFANTGNNNTATGASALLSNTTGEDNTANGLSALGRNVEGSWNTAMGSQALASNTGFDNTAVGFQALMNNTGGSSNAAIGSHALLSNTGSFNAGMGWYTLGGNTTGNSNTALGYGALFTNTTGSANVALGAFAGKGVTIGFNVMCLGYGVLGADVDNSTWIGNVWGVTTQSGNTAPVVVSDSGQLGTVASSERFKKDIANMATASEAILALRPVTFHYKTDARETPQFGLVAEEVAKINPALVVPDKDGKPYTVRYDAVNAMLLNEFLKEHRKIEKLEAALRAVNERLAEQDAKIAKVSAQLELSKSAPQTVLNDR